MWVLARLLARGKGAAFRGAASVLFARAVSARQIDGCAALGARPKSTLVVIGNFDGVHLGHQAVLASAVDEAERHGLAPVVLTFDPHPVVVLGRGTPSVLTPMPRRVELIGRVSPALTVVVEPFTLELSALLAREFVERLLLRELGAAAVLVGRNFCFGRGRKGDIALLGELGTELGFRSRAHELEGDQVGSYSSSRVRGAIEAGDVRGAAAVLGRPHAISGRVVRGAARGRTLGFPTANLGGVVELAPKQGVYACLVDRLEGGRARVLGVGVANLGVRPTLGAGASTEVHLLDFDGDLYDAELRVHFVDRLRDEQRFDGPGALVRQIQQDVAEARRLLSAATPDPAANGAWS